MTSIYTFVYFFFKYLRARNRNRKYNYTCILYIIHIIIISIVITNSIYTIIHTLKFKLKFIIETQIKTAHLDYYIIIKSNKLQYYYQAGSKNIGVRRRFILYNLDKLLDLIRFSDNVLRVFLMVYKKNI